jgi:S1-C subfamily serine protease
METEDADNDRNSFVARIFRDETFIGTGFLVHADRILTCFHVTKDLDIKETLKVRLSGGTLHTGRVVGTNEAYDLALIEIPMQAARTPVRFLIGLKTEHEGTLRQLNWQAIGYDLRDSETFLSVASVGHEPAFQWDSKTGTLLEVQVNLGLPVGFSGGPVLVEVGENTFCLGISTLGGTDRPKSRIRLADCIVGFLQGCGLALKTQAVHEVFPSLPRQRSSCNAGKRNRSWRWVAAVGLLAVAAFAGLYPFLKPAPRQPSLAKEQTPVPATTVLPFYQVKIMLYSSNAPPQLYINKKRATLDAYDGRTATLHLHPGNYRVEADYDSIDKICTATVSVPRDLSTEAECHLR